MENVLYDFEETFLELIKYANRRHEAILLDYQLVSSKNMVIFRVLHRRWQFEGGGELL